jgi:hypothetical protein
VQKAPKDKARPKASSYVQPANRRNIDLGLAVLTLSDENVLQRRSIALKTFKKDNSKHRRNFVDLLNELGAVRVPIQSLTCERVVFDAKARQWREEGRSIDDLYIIDATPAALERIVAHYTVREVTLDCPTSVGMRQGTADAQTMQRPAYKAMMREKRMRAIDKRHERNEGYVRDETQETRVKDAPVTLEQAPSLAEPTLVRRHKRGRRGPVNAPATADQRLGDSEEKCAQKIDALTQLAYELATAQFVSLETGRVETFAKDTAPPLRLPEERKQQDWPNMPLGSSRLEAARTAFDACSSPENYAELMAAYNEE